MPARFLTSPADLPRRPDVVIAGAGVAGLATAFFLSRAGIRPLVLERLPAPAMLASRRSGEGVRAQWEKPGNIALARASIAHYAGFAALTGREAGYRPIGYLYASRTAAGAAHLQARVARQQAAGLEDVRYLDGPALHARFPTLSPEVAGGAFRQGDGVVEIDRVLAGYLAAMEADILCDVSVTGIAPGPGGPCLATTAGEIHAGAAVLATAARTPELLVGLGVRLPMRLARSAIQHVTLAGVPPDHPATIDTDLGSFWRPDAGGARMTASFRSTLFLDRFTDDPEVDPDYLARAIATVAPLVPFWGRRAHEIAGGHLRSGSLLVTGDGGPLIGPVPGVPGLWLNTGYGGHGIMASPAGADMLTGLITGTTRDAPFDPARLLGPVAPEPEPMTVNLAGAPALPSQDAVR